MSCTGGLSQNEVNGMSTQPLRTGHDIECGEAAPVPASVRRGPFRLGIHLGAATILLGMAVGAGPLTARATADTTDPGSRGPSAAAGASPGSSAPKRATRGPIPSGTAAQQNSVPNVSVGPMTPRPAAAKAAVSKTAVIHPAQPPTLPETPAALTVAPPEASATVLTGPAAPAPVALAAVPAAAPVAPAPAAAVPVAPAAAVLVPPVAVVVPAPRPADATALGSATVLPAAAADPISGAAAVVGLSTGPLGDVLQAAALQVLGVRQTRQAVTMPSGATGTIAAAAATPAPAAAVSAPVLPITVGWANSFTTFLSTTAAGSVTTNGHAWVADPTTHLYTTTTDLAAEWKTNYTQMKAGNGASLNDIQRLEGNAEAVFENTGLKNLTAAQQAVDRQDVQRQFDAMYAGMVGAGVDITQPLTQQQYLATETVMQTNPTLEELGMQGHGLNLTGIVRYGGYTTDFQNTVDAQTLYVGGGLNNGQNALTNFVDDNILSHMPFPSVINNGVPWQLNQALALEHTVADSVAALNVSMTRTYLSSDFLQPPQLGLQTGKQVFTNGQAIDFTLPAGTFVDLQGQEMTYTATLGLGIALPSWASFNTATGQFTGIPPSGTPSTRIYVTATNASGLKTAESFDVQFKQPAPVIVKQTPNQTAVAGKAFFLFLPANTFVDPLGQFMTYSATGPLGAALPSWLTFSPVIKLLSGTAPVGTNSTTVVVTATNFWGAKTSESFAIVVN